MTTKATDSQGNSQTGERTQDGAKRPLASSVELREAIEELIKNYRIMGVCRPGQRCDQCDSQTVKLAQSLLNLFQTHTAKADRMGRIDELQKLNSYYLQHDGEGEHLLAGEFIDRLTELSARKEVDNG